MDIKRLFFDIENFLEKHEDLWQKEPFLDYPNFPNKYKDFLKKLEKRNTNELIKLENLEEDYEIEFFQEIKSLVNLIPKETIQEKAESSQNMIKVSLKKEHEVKRISSLLQDKPFSRVIEACSGIGHTSIRLIKDFNCHAICLDYDQALINSGERLIKKYYPNYQEKLKFIKFDLNKDNLATICKNDLIIGLHACGDLSIKLFELTKNEEINYLSIPCCYHKLTRLNLSNSQKLKLSFHALSLANKSNLKLSFKSYQERRKIKTYRYGLEFLYFNQFHKKLPSLGFTHKKVYQGSFKDYLKNYDKNSFLLENIDKNFQNMQEVINNFILLETIRNPIGRLIELYIMLDRVLFLQKQKGLNVKIFELFDPLISPRNIALYAYRN